MTTEAAPSTVEAELAPQSAPVEVEELSDSQRAEWTRSGELPAQDIKPKTDDSATSKPGADTGAKKAESGTAVKEPVKRKGAEERKLELDAEIKDRLEKRGVLKSDEFWKEFEEFRTSKNGEKKAAPPAVDAKTPPDADSRLPKPPEKPARPNIEQFKTTAEYNLAMDKYDGEMEQYSAKKSAFDDATKQFERNQAEIVEFNKGVETKWKGMVAKAEEVHGDFKEVALSDDLAKNITMGSPVDEWVLQSEVGAEMLYFLGQNRDELKRINALSRPAQHRELAKLEEKLSATGVEAEKPKPKIVSSALPPTREVGGKGTASGDEEEAALRKAADGDPSDYIALQNKRDLAKRKFGTR